MAWRPCSGVFPVPHWFLQPGLSLDAHVLNLPAGHSSPVCLDGLLGAEPIALGDGLGLGHGLKIRVDLGDGLGLGHEGCVNHGERVRLGHGFNEGVHKHASDEVVEGLSDVHCIGHGNPVGDGLNVADGIASGIISSIVSRVTLSEQFWLRHGFSESVLYGISKRHEKPTGERHGVLEQRFVFDGNGNCDAFRGRHKRDDFCIADAHDIPDRIAPHGCEFEHNASSDANVDRLAVRRGESWCDADSDANPGRISFRIGESELDANAVTVDRSDAIDHSYADGVANAFAVDRRDTIFRVAVALALSLAHAVAVDRSDAIDHSNADSVHSNADSVADAFAVARRDTIFPAAFALSLAHAVAVDRSDAIDHSNADSVADAFAVEGRNTILRVLLVPHRNRI